MLVVCLTKSEEVKRQRVRGCAQAAGPQQKETEMKHRIQFRAVGNKEAERMSYTRTFTKSSTYI